MGFNSNLSARHVYAVLIKENSAENVLQAYLPDILAHKDGSVAILSDNGTKFKNKVSNEVCNQLSI